MNDKVLTESHEPLNQGHRSLRSAFPIATIALLAFFLNVSSGMQLLSPPKDPIDVGSSVPIRLLLVEQWDRGPNNESQSKATYQNSRKDNSYLMLAFALNRMNHNRVDEALEIVDLMTKSYADNLDGWLLKAWLNTLSDRYDTALVNLRSLKKQIGKQKNTTPAIEQVLYGRLGRLFGYLQGPVADRVNANLLEGTVLNVTAGLNPDVLKTFNSNRDKVLKQYEDLLKLQGQMTQAELAKVKLENDNQTIALERETQLLEQTESQLVPEKQRLRAEATQQVSTLQQQGRSLEQQLAAISSDIWDTEQELQFLAVELYNAQNLPPRLRPSLFYLQNRIRNVQVTQSALRSNGNQISNQLDVLRAQVLQTQRAYNQRIGDIDREIKRVNGAKRRNLGKLARLAAGPEVADGKKDAMRNKATALRTYDDLPLVLYRQELLEKLTDQ